MHPDKSPGPDGCNHDFYQQYWHLIGNDISQACISWLEGGIFPPFLTNTTIVLIPETAHPTALKDLQPIALCNVLYQIIAEVLANRLKPILDSIVDEAQSAFVPRRLISDNVIIAFEVIHYMKTKPAGKHGDAH